MKYSCFLRRIFMPIRLARAARLARPLYAVFF
jgi:hypothetical protein